MKHNKSIYHVVLVVTMVLMVMVLPTPAAMAFSDGPSNPSQGANVDLNEGMDWQDPGEIVSPGEPYATATLTQGSLYSDYLQGTDYGFVIPDDVTITGIEVAVNRRVITHNANIMDYELRLLKDGTVTGENKASDVTWPTSFTVETYGGPTDLWGADWTPADINSPYFGASLAAYRDNNGSNDRKAGVDSMQVTVYYKISASSEVVCGDGMPVAYGDTTTCMVSVTSQAGELTPTGSVDWSTDVNGIFDPGSCTLEGEDGTATCQVSYTPHAVGSGEHLIGAAYSGDENFAPVSASEPLTVTLRPITVSADAQTKTYGDPDPLLTYQITQGSLVFSDTFTGTLSRVDGEDAGEYEILQGSLALPADYELSYVSALLTIEKAQPTCEVTPYDVEYDGNVHTATGSCTGIYGEELAGLDLSGTSHVDAGTYTDTWTFTDQTGNYADTEGTLVDIISPAEPLCSVTPYDLTYDTQPHTAEGACLGLDGQPLEGLDLSGTTHTDAGSYVDEWVFSDPTGNYSDMNGSVTDHIARAEATCMVTGYTLEYDRQAHTASGSCTGVAGEELEGLELSGTTHTEIGSYADDPWTFTDSNGNYNEQAGTVDDEITLRFITVTADMLSKPYGQPDPELTYQVTSGSLLEGDAFSGELSRQPGERVGSYAILLGTLSLPDYYQLGFQGADFNITGSIFLFPMMLNNGF